MFPKTEKRPFFEDLFIKYKHIAWSDKRCSQALIKNVSEKTLYRDLQDLVGKNILKEIGEKKGRKYELA